MQLPNAPLSQVADIIRKNWPNMSVYARPYAQVMLQLPSIQSNYYADSGKDMVLYFLANAQTWRGPVAKLVKEELNRRL